MFNYKLALSKFNLQNKQRQNPPADFGSMYYLYPPETVNYFDDQSIGFIDKIFDLIFRRAKRSDQDIEYYKNCEI